VPAIFHVPVSSLRDEKEHAIGFIPLAGNPLDVAVVDGGIIVSMDIVHETGSITSVDESEVCKFMGVFDLTLISHRISRLDSSPLI
jgi:hypothetical protein